PCAKTHLRRGSLLPHPLSSSDLLRNLPVQEPAQAAPRAAHADVKVPEKRINRADLIKPHLVNELLEHQRVVSKQINPPLPVVETDRTGDDLFYLAGVTAADQTVLVHLPCTFLHG